MIRPENDRPSDPAKLFELRVLALTIERDLRLEDVWSLGRLGHP
jgi:hypothetical protein